MGNKLATFISSVAITVDVVVNITGITHIRLAKRLAINREPKGCSKVVAKTGRYKIVRKWHCDSLRQP